MEDANTFGAHGRRPPPEEAACAIVAERYPDALAAFAAGSVFRGEGTATSDLDLVVVVDRPEAPFRESFVALGWPVEAFVQTEASCAWFSAKDAASRVPCLPSMLAEGIVVRDTDGVTGRIRRAAQDLLASGPAPLTDDERTWRRYAVTDLLEDLRGATVAEEAAYIAPALASEAGNLLLAHRRCWGGHGKGLVRALSRYTPEEGQRLTAALLHFNRTGDRAGVIAFVQDVLEEAGGPMFDGFHQAGPRDARGEAGG